MRPKVIAIVGPTSSGKSDLAVRLAKMIRGLPALPTGQAGGRQGEVVSADSRQVYRGIDLASGKITEREMNGVPHHLLDVADPKRPYSAARYVKNAQEALRYITVRGSIPIVVGGTGFYIDTLLRGISLPEVPPNATLRKKLSEKTAAELYLILTKRDPVRAKTIERQNPVRLIRAIEIAQALGKIPRVRRTKIPYDVLWIGLKPSDQALQKRIRARIGKRLKAGMVAEARRLHARGLSYKRMRELGLELGHLADLLQKKITLAVFKEKLERDIVRYTKRQMRWFKRENDIRWFRSGAKAFQFVSDNSHFA